MEHIKTTFRISPEAHLRLEQLAKEIGVTRQELVEQLILGSKPDKSPTTSPDTFSVEELTKVVRKLERDVTVLIGAMNTLLVELGYSNYYSIDEHISPVIDQAYNELSNTILENQTRNINK